MSAQAGRWTDWGETNHDAVTGQVDSLMVPALMVALDSHFGKEEQQVSQIPDVDSTPLIETLEETEPFAVLECLLDDSFDLHASLVDSAGSSAVDQWAHDQSCADL